MSEAFLTAADVAALLSVSRSTAYRIIRQCVHEVGPLRVSSSGFDRWVKTNTVWPKCVQGTPRSLIDMAAAEWMSPGWIYVVAARGMNLVKIGFTGNLDRRIRDLRRANAVPLDVVRAGHGTMRLERAIHAHLAHHRQHGEWFERCDAVDAVTTCLLTTRPWTHEDWAA